MNRGLIGFLAFLAVLLLAFGVAAYVLGPNMLAFIFHGDRRTEPVVIVNLVDFVDADHAQTYARDFETPAIGLIATLGGHEVWKASAADVVHGQLQDGWSSLDLVAYPSRAAFIELVTSSDYRALLGARDAAVKRAATYAATPIEPSQNAFDPQDTQAQALRFMTGAHADSIATYDSKWLGEDAQMLERHGGVLLWRARLSPLVADEAERFDEILVYGFRDTEMRDEWVGDTERETLQTLQRRLFRRDVLVLSDAQQMVQPPAPTAVLDAPPASPPAPVDATNGAADAPAAAGASDDSTAPAVDQVPTESNEP
ncbi:MAG TPA: hypothetical protein VMJ74_14335 [Pseudomonadales bacterium]|nr:hypothetical protein [Pseudomonadales bacterium]